MLWLQVLNEVTAKSIYGRNAEGVKVAKAQVQRGSLMDGTPIIGMTMLPDDYRHVPLYSFVICLLRACQGPCAATGLL
jgi:hypothetical protein